MFIIWGSYNREKERGVVADKCLHCAQVARLHVKQIYRVSHVYFIPLGSGSLVATVLTCTECKGQMTAPAAGYHQILPRHKTTGMSTGQILAETNPELCDAVTYRAELERRAREVIDVVPGMPDPRVELAFARLAELDPHHPEASRLHSRLTQWASLDAAAQAQVLRDLDTLVDAFEDQQATIRFVRFMGSQFKPEVDGGVALLAFLVLAALGITAAVMLFSAAALFASILAVIGVAIGLAIFSHHKFRRYKHRKFFRTTFLPQAHQQGVDVVRAIAILQEIDPSNAAFDPGIRGMAGALPLLHQVVKEANPDGDVAEAVAALAETYPTRKFRKTFNWVGPVVIVGTIVMCAGGVYWFTINDQEKQRVEAERRNAYTAPFQARLQEYLPNAPQHDLQPAYRHGMVMTINYLGRGMDPMLLTLPAGLRPDKPNDVGTIVWLRWGQDVVGRYTDGVNAVVITCHVTLIDKSKGTIIAEKQFVGSQPPAKRRHHSDSNQGSNPTGEIINWLQSLPMK